MSDIYYWIGLIVFLAVLCTFSGLVILIIAIKGWEYWKQSRLFKYIDYRRTKRTLLKMKPVTKHGVSALYQWSKYVEYGLSKHPYAHRVISAIEYRKEHDESFRKHWKEAMIAYGDMKHLLTDKKQ